MNYVDCLLSEFEFMIWDDLSKKEKMEFINATKTIQSILKDRASVRLNNVINCILKYSDEID